MAHQVRFVDTGDLFEVESGETVLEAALRSGVELAHECTLGGCGTCRVRVDQGSVTYREFPTGLTEQEHAEGYALTCQALAASDLIVVSNAISAPGGMVDLDLTLTGTSALTNGQQMLLIDLVNAGQSMGAGTLWLGGTNQLIQGESFTVAGGSYTNIFAISYVGGTDNNDVILTVIPEPATVSMMLLIGAGLTLRRRMLRKQG